MLRLAIESRTPRIDCLALFVYPPPSNLIRSLMNILPSAVHSSSTIESGATPIDCLALFVYPPTSNLIRSLMNLLPSAVYSSSTIEFGELGLMLLNLIRILFCFILFLHLYFCVFSHSFTFAYKIFVEIPHVVYK